MPKYQGVAVTLNDGQPYVIPPLTLRQVRMFQDRLQGHGGGIGQESIDLTLDVLHAALSRNYPDITREQLEDVVDVANMVEAFQAVMDVSGLRRKEQEAASAGEPAPV